MEPKANLIVNATIQDMEAVQEYSTKAFEIFKKQGAEMVSKFKISETLIGNTSVNVVSVTEFPSTEVLKNTFELEEYKALLPLREKAFSELNVFIG